MVTAFSGLSVTAAAKTSKWEGYLKIFSAGDLLRMKDSSQKFYLTKDIDLKDNGLWEEEITFKGTLDGNGYCIKNLTSTKYGLFYKLDGATVQNLGLTNVKIKSSQEHIGALTGWCQKTEIKSCYVTGSVETEYRPSLSKRSPRLTLQR